MRSTIAVATLVAALLTGTSALAERRIFIIANNADGYGVDRCLARGENCGNAVASAYCRSQQFARAVSYRKVDRGEITGGVPFTGSAACRGAACSEFVAIECTR